ncbi:MAG: ImpA family type VI secretion system protein [Brucella intermedia]
MFINSQLLTSPIQPSAPTGVDLRQAETSDSLYYRARDARNSARAVERSSFVSEAPSVIHEWREVYSLSIEILESQSRDIEVFSWLIEAVLRIEGFSGLADVLEICCNNLNSFWNELHSVSNVTSIEKSAPLIMLNGVGSDGVLIQPLRLTSLFPDLPFGQGTLWDYERSSRSGQESVRNVLVSNSSKFTPDELRKQIDAIDRSLSWWNRLTDILVEKCVDDPPTLSAVREILESATNAARELTKAQLLPQGHDAPVHSSPLATNSMEYSPELRPVGTRFESRCEALLMIAEVAEYFHRHEPHSPIGLGLETMINRSELNFERLLVELIPDKETRNQVMLAAGIKPNIQD